MFWLGLHDNQMNGRMQTISPSRTGRPWKEKTAEITMIRLQVLVSMNSGSNSQPAGRLSESLSEYRAVGWRTTSEESSSPAGSDLASCNTFGSASALYIINSRIRIEVYLCSYLCHALSILLYPPADTIACSWSFLHASPFYERTPPSISSSLAIAPLFAD